MEMIKLTGYARYMLILFGVLILVGVFTTPGIQWFAAGFGGWIVGLGLTGEVPRFVKAKPQTQIEVHNHPALPIIDTKEVKWNRGR